MIGAIAARRSRALVVAVAIAAQTLVVATPADSATTFYVRDGFHGPRLNSALWRAWWGTVKMHDGQLSLESRNPTRASQTFSALVTSRKAWRNFAFDYLQTNVSHLRRNSKPNTWEVAWSMFRFRDLENYYYFILKPNGWELGKKHGSDDQIFLATGASPATRMRKTDRIRITAVGPVITVWVNGARILRYTDPRPITSGAVGLYEEDAHVHFDWARVYSA